MLCLIAPYMLSSANIQVCNSKWDLIYRFFPQRSIGSALLELLIFCASYLIAKQVPKKKNVKFIDTIFFTIHISGKFILQNLKYIFKTYQYI